MENALILRQTIAQRKHIKRSWSRTKKSGEPLRLACGGDDRSFARRSDSIMSHTPHDQGVHGEALGFSFSEFYLCDL
jgi:hypothetical protein